MHFTSNYFHVKLSLISKTRISRLDLILVALNLVVDIN